MGVVHGPWQMTLASLSKAEKDISLYTRDEMGTRRLVEIQLT